MSPAQPTPSRPSVSDRRTSTLQKRASILPKPSSIVLDPSVLIAQHAQLTGTHPITVGPRTVLHPHSKVSSALTAVVLGEGVILHERAKVGAGMGDGADAHGKSSSIALRPSARDSTRGEGTVLGRNVVVETNAIVEAAEVGEWSLVEVGAHLGKGCVVGKVYISETQGRFADADQDSFVPSPRTALCPLMPICRTTRSFTAEPYPPLA